MRKPVVAAIAFDGIRPFHLSVPCLVFGEDRTPEGLPIAGAAISWRVAVATPPPPAGVFATTARQ